MIRHRVILSILGLLLVYVMGACSTASGNPTAETVTPEPGVTGEPAISATPLPVGTPDGETEEADPDVVVKVNGRAIGRLEFERQVARFQAAMISQGYSFSGEEGKEAARQVRKQVLEAMIDQMLIEQAAIAQGISVAEDVLQQRIQSDIDVGGGKEDFENWLEMNGLTIDEYEQMMRSTILTEEMIRRLGTDVPDSMNQVHIRQILVATEREAQDLHRQLEAGADFAELASKYSLDESSRMQGGDRGFLPIGTSVLSPELEAATMALNPGEFSEPIASPYGYYIVMVVEVQQARPLAAEMRQGLTQEAFIDWIQSQRMSANIERFINLDG